MTMTDDADVPPPAGYTVRPNGRPTGRSNKWANVSVRPRSSRSKSPPPLFDTGPAAPYRADSVGQASRSLNASNSLPARRATLSPVPPGCALPTLVRPQPKRQCRGIYDGCFGLEFLVGFQSGSLSTTSAWQPRRQRNTFFCGGDVGLHPGARPCPRGNNTTSLTWQ